MLLFETLCIMVKIQLALWCCLKKKTWTFIHSYIHSFHSHSITFIDWVYWVDWVSLCWLWRTGWYSPPQSYTNEKSKIIKCYEWLRGSVTSCVNITHKHKKKREKKLWHFPVQKSVYFSVPLRLNYKELYSKVQTISSMAMWEKN